MNPPSTSRKAGFSLIECLLALSLLLIMSLITARLYQNVEANLVYFGARMETRKVLRQALSRITPVLQTAYIPPLPGANRCFEKPLPPYPSAVNATDPLMSQGPGVNSFLFYTPVDVLDPQASLLPPERQEVHLFELRLLESLEPDREAQGGPSRTLRNLVLQQRRVPSQFGLSPFPLLANRQRVLARGLSDLRLFRIGTVGLHLRLEAQARVKRLVPGRALLTDQLESKVYFPVVSNS